MTKNSQGKQSRMIQERSREVYARSLLREGEALVQVADIHPGIYWKSIALVFITIFLLLTLTPLGYFMAIVTAISFSFAYLTKHYLLLALTDRRVLVRHGIVNLDVVEIQLKRVESVELSRTIMGRILGYATVLITGTGSRVTAIPYIGHAEAFRSALDNMIYEREDAPIRVKAE